MFSRFTTSARRVMQRAFREAKRWQHDFVGTEHLLFGLLCDADGPAVTLLRTLNAQPDLMLAKVELSLQRHDGGASMEQFPLSPASRRAIRTAAGEAEQFHHQMIGPEHLLLGLLRESECEAAQILSAHHVAFNTVRSAVARLTQDADRDAQIQTGTQPPFAQADNPSAQELEDWIAPRLTADALTSSSPVFHDAQSIEIQLRRTQLVLGTLMGYVVGHWIVGWEAGVLVALLGFLLAFVNNTGVSVAVCTVVPIGLIVLKLNLNGDLRSLNYLLVAPLGALFGSFLGDLWRQGSQTYEIPTRAEGYPVQPTGIPVTAETLLEIGMTVLAYSQGYWWRATVLALEDRDHVHIRYQGWEPKREAIVTRTVLQMKPDHASDDSGV